MVSEPSSDQCTCTPVHETQFKGESERSPSIGIVEAIAAVEGVAPSALRPLSDEINLEAVDSLFEHQNGAAEPPKLLRFTVDGWNIFVRDDGTIRVCDPTSSAEPEPVFERALDD